MARTETVTKYVEADDNPNYETEHALEGVCEAFDHLATLVDRAIAEQNGTDDQTIEVGALSLAWQAKGTVVEEDAYELAYKMIDDSRLHDDPSAPLAQHIALACGITGGPPTTSTP